MLSPKVSVLLATVLVTVEVDAQPISPTGAEFRVNTTTAGPQISARVASVTGPFVVVWSGPSGGAYQIFGQRFSASGSPEGGEFRVNTSTSAGSFDPGVGRAASGSFVVVWRDSQLRGRRFDAAGVPLGPEFRVDDVTALPTFPSVGVDANTGAFTVAWRAGAGAAADVLARRFDGTGPALGASFRVNTTTSGEQTYPVVAIHKSGTSMIVWQGPGPNGDQDVLAQRFAAGAPVASEFRVSTISSDNQRHPAIAVDGAGAGTFMVAWTGGYGIAAQAFRSAGEPVGTEVSVEQIGGKRAAVALHSAGSFVVAWSVRYTNYEIVARRVTSAGPKGPAQRVNTTSPGQYPAASFAGSDAFVVAWTHNTSGDLDIFARRFCFTRGDVNGDDAVNVGDVLYFINFLFAGGPDPVTGADANGDNAVNVSDVLFLINHLFAGGPAPGCL